MVETSNIPKMPSATTENKVGIIQPMNVEFKADIDEEMLEETIKVVDGGLTVSEEIMIDVYVQASIVGTPSIVPT